jgi:uncharacterized protein
MDTGSRRGRMFNRFLPKEYFFFDYFEQHARITVIASQSFYRMILEDQISLHEGINPIKVLEHQANKIADQCIEALHKSFITPFRQDDIFRLISGMDEIINRIEEAFENCLIYRIVSFTSAGQEMIRLLVLAAEKIEFLIKGLRNRKKLVVSLREACSEIHQIESKADELVRKSIGQLFDEEKDIRLLIKWKEIYAVLEKAINDCEKVSDIIEGIIMEYS